VLDAFEQATLPFEKIVELAATERGTDLHPLHQVMFVLLEQELPSLDLGSTNGRRVQLQTHTSKCDLTFSVIASDEGWDCKLEYASDLFSKEFAAQLARHLKEILEAIAEAPDKPVDQLRLMPEHERQQILVDWNRTGRDYPRDKCIQQLFEEQVQRSPDAVAVSPKANRSPTWNSTSGPIGWQSICNRSEWGLMSWSDSAPSGPLG
jgi:non-ribosomal peptide synthetase component F